jgi:hypothetical protein
MFLLLRLATVRPGVNIVITALALYLYLIFGANQSNWLMRYVRGYIV